MRRLLPAAIATAFLLLSVPFVAQAGQSWTGILSAPDWLNGHVTPGDLKGKVVLVDFYTFGCINCKHVQPNLRELYKTKSRNDLVIVSIHSPETPFERDRHNLVASTKEQGVQWPVAIDNDFKLWNEFGVSAWPTQLIYDRHGVLRQTVVGEGQDQLVNDTVDSLIANR